MHLLVHACCAPCLTYPAHTLQANGHELTIYWFNPYIHPYTEFSARLAALRTYAEQTGLRVVYAPAYDVDGFMAMALAAKKTDEKRCLSCYRRRLDETAKYAAANGFDGFTTTLLVSPYQDHDALRAIGSAAADAQGTTFYYEDFRPGFRAGQQMARDAGLYMQKYCGCILSEAERYEKKYARLADELTAPRR